MSLNVKQGDNVVVIAGKDKGKTGRVLSVNTKAGSVVVDNVNIVTKHRKPRGAQQPGGKSKEPAAVDVSNVQIICPSCNKATRVKAGESDGKKIRACGKCGASLDVKAKADKKKKSKKAETAAEEPEVKKPAKKSKKTKEPAPEAVEVSVEADAEPEKKKPSAKKTAEGEQSK